MKKLVIILGSLLVVAGLLFSGYLYWLNNISFKYAEKNAMQLTQSPTPEQQVSPTQTEEEVVIPEGWLTYTNEDYGFEISYPSDYEALTDEENLYGWPNAVVLFYKGGQSYDLPIEVWDTQKEYEAKYPNQTNLTVKEVSGKFITLLNMNLDPEVDEIINTFKPL